VQFLGGPTYFFGLLVLIFSQLWSGGLLLYQYRLPPE
jgi:hypothetical protein